MDVYFITYDLRKKRDYETLYEELEKFKAVRVLKSTWSLNRDNTSASDLKDHFVKFIDSDDGLLVDKCVAWAVHKVDKTPKKFS